MICDYGDKSPKLHETVSIFEGAQIVGDVKIGEGSSVWYNAVIRGDVNKIRIGKNVSIQDLTMVHCRVNKYPTFIGNNVTVGHNVVLHGCTIGNNVLVGMGAIILDGAVIGDNSIIGAGSLITQRKTFPPNSLILGSPAKVVRELTKEEIADTEFQAIHYRHLAESYDSNSNE